MPTRTLHGWRALSLASFALLTAACFVDTGDTSGPGHVDTTAATASVGTDAASTATEAATEVPTTGGPDPTSDPTSGGTDATTGDMDATTGGMDPTSGGGDQFCQERCRVDADCNVMGKELGFVCADGRCTGGAGSCAEDIDCRVQYSGWSVACVGQQDCPGQVCIDIGGGEGRCATAPSNFVKCETLKQSETTMPPIEGGAPIAVCAELDYVCTDNLCTDPCESDAECVGVLGNPHCEVGTGVCRCTSDDDCKGAGVDGWSVCHGGVCGCASDEDCFGVNTDVCNPGGFCGCSDGAVCTQKGFDGTMSECAGR